MPPVTHKEVKPSVRPATPFWLGGFILFLCLLPLPFGGNRPWASDLFAAASAVFLCLMAAGQPKPMLAVAGTPSKRIWTAIAGVSLVVVWAYLQTVSWLPNSLHHPLWQESAALLGDISGSVSIAPDAFAESLARFLSYVACFVIAFSACRDASRARLILKWVVYSGAIYALYGLLVQASGSNTILWFKKWAYEGFLTSTFVNKNSYAAFAGIGFLSSLALLWDRFRDFSPKDKVLARQSKTAAVFSSLSAKDLCLLFLPVVFMGALALTGSRAGAASSLVGVMAFLISMALHRRWSLRRWGILLAACFLVFLLSVSMGGDALLSRLGESKLDEDTTMRLTAYDLAVQAIADNPWLGYGLGSFDSAFHLYRNESLPLWFHHAHNDYLEMMMDLGIPVAICLFLSIGALASCCAGALRQRRKNGVYPALALGSSALLGVHAFVDFSLHIPAIAATYATLLGLGVAQSWSSREDKPAETKPRPVQQHASIPAQPAPLRKMTPAPMKKIEVPQVTETAPVVKEAQAAKPAVKETATKTRKPAKAQKSSKAKDSSEAKKPRKGKEKGTGKGTGKKSEKAKKTPE